MKLLLHLPQFESNKDSDIEYKPTGFGLEQWIGGELFCRSRAWVFERAIGNGRAITIEAKKTVPEGYRIELSFARPQFAPIALGYAAHFGLGVFAPGRVETNVGNARGEEICCSIDSS